MCKVDLELDIMEKYDSIPSLGEQQTSSRVFTCLVVFAEVIYV